MNIDIETLERAFHNILIYLREVEGTSIEVDKDFYWNIPHQQRYDPYQIPTDLTLGQLSSDWEHIQEIASGKEEPVAYSLVWLASLLKYFGENKPT